MCVLGGAVSGIEQRQEVTTKRRGFPGAEAIVQDARRAVESPCHIMLFVNWSHVTTVRHNVSLGDNGLRYAGNDLKTIVHSH